MSSISGTMSRTMNPEPVPSRDTIRWLLRPLADDAFLPLYLDPEAEQLAPRAFEHAFWALPPDGERPEKARGEAWLILKPWLSASRGPIDWYRTIVARLCEAAWQDPLRELASFWALPELFASEAPGDPLVGYHEIHCHLRGAVPYLFLWKRWLDDERACAQLRGEDSAYRTDQRSKTWAELVTEAREHRARCAAAGAPSDDEGEFIAELVKRIVDVRTGDERLAASAVRYLATCATLRRHLVHQRGKAGLSLFVKSYERYSKVQKIRGSAERAFTRDDVRAVLCRFEEEGAVSVELRPTLERRPCALRQKLCDVVLGYFDYLEERLAERPPSTIPSQQPLVFGIVPSLFKQEAVSDGPVSDPSRWEDQAEIWRSQVDALLACLDDVPALRWFVVGIDAAGKEHGCPPRAFGAAIAAIRRYNGIHGVALARPGRPMSVGMLAALAKEQSPLDALNCRFVSRIRLGVTVHAGEDFTEPLTGLRHIWETARCLDLRPGDRIGHALAAGLDPARLRMLLERRCGAGAGSDTESIGGGCFRVRKPRGTHLLDLAWEQHLAETDAGRRAITARLAEVGTRAFGAPVEAERLGSALLGGTALVRTVVPAVRFTDPEHVDPADREWVILDDAWFETFERLRPHVHRELSRRQIVVESCPTSNCAVANLDAPPLEALREHGFRVAMATDDPELFGAWPRAEIARFPALRDELIGENRRASFVVNVGG
jgi:hypothetical protein